MKLSIIIVNYNVCGYLERCLRSVYRATEALVAEIIVIDNASTDGSREYISARFPHLIYIYNAQNVGFARACNQGIRQARGAYILLLNPDTLLAADTLITVLAFADAHPEAGAIGVKMVDENGRFLPESKRGIPTPLVALGKLTGLYRLFPSSRRLNGYYRNDLNADAVHRVEVLAGAFMLMPRAVLDKVGLLDEDFFMYGEDIELSVRILQGGYVNYYLPCPIVHYKGKSTRRKCSLRYIRSFYGAMLIYYRKCKNVHNPYKQ
ncbi:MAG: glycosyltransferase family 2 protein [Prevotellaceae bacterium]|jgi:GT2 family glycosyltransferase|nr:glycosyltransferase family 2 protein [Prevotellaceae bacterium]